MLQELKEQHRDLTRKLKDAREAEVEKALRDFMKIILDERMPMEIKEEAIVNSFKRTVISIFEP